MLGYRRGDPAPEDYPEKRRNVIKPSVVKMTDDIELVSPPRPLPLYVQKMCSAAKSCADTIVNPKKEEDGSVLVLKLPNIPGQKYTFGSSYPGQMELIARRRQGVAGPPVAVGMAAGRATLPGDEFIFCKYQRDLLDPTHCVITVTDGGHYHLRNFRDTAITFVNGNLLKGGHRLKIGDVISLGDLDTFDEDYKGGPVFRVRKRKFEGSDRLAENIKVEPMDLETEDLNKHNNLQDSLSFPGENPLILSIIFGFLPFEDLKKARLVCKKWKQEAAPLLEKKAKISFSFGVDYLAPLNSTRVFRYLHEMNGLKLPRLDLSFNTNTNHLSSFRVSKQLTFRRDDGGEDVIRVSDMQKGDPFIQNPLLFTTGEPGSKVVPDLRALLSSNHSFRSVLLSGVIAKELDFITIHIIIRHLGNIEELRLQQDIQSTHSTTTWGQIRNLEIPVLDLLKKFQHFVSDEEIRGVGERQAIYGNYASLLVSAFRGRLEDFACSGAVARFYLEEIIKFPDVITGLEKITIEDVHSEDLELLLELRKPLVSLSLPHFGKLIPTTKFKNMEEVSTFEDILHKNMDSLETLHIDLDSELVVTLDFPPLKKLKKLSFTYGPNIRIKWGSSMGSQVVDYSKEFPSLKVLEIQPRCVEVSRETGVNPNLPFQWENEEDLFNSFFPMTNTGLKCETVRVLRVPEKCANPFAFRETSPETREKYQERLEIIKAMFTNLHGGEVTKTRLEGAKRIPF